MSFSAGSTIDRDSSGSTPCISSVEPLMSANNALTVLRSPSTISVGDIASLNWGPVGGALGRTRRADGLVAAPHSPQNFSSGSLEAPHFEQVMVSGAPQFEQNLRPSRLSLSHFEQRILRMHRLGAQLVEQRLSLFQIGGVEAFGETVVDFGEHRARLITTALRGEQACKAGARAQFPRFGAHLLREGNRLAEIGLSQRRLPLLEPQFTTDP